MKKRFMMFIASVLLIATAGCTMTTEFTGSPKIPNGAQGCRAVCQSQGMNLAGMVFMGEYSDGCICAVPGADSNASMCVAGAGPAVVGVRMQMDEIEAQEERQRQHHHQQQQHYHQQHQQHHR